MRLGIDVGGTKIEGIALHQDRELARIRVPTPRDDYEATLEAIAGVVADLDAASGARGRVGVGIPGTITPETGLVKNANSVWLIGRPLQADLQRLLGRELRVANDANCFAASEAIDGAGAGADVVFAVIIGTGTGAGIVVNRRVLTGSQGIAGEWGHNPMPWPTPTEWPGPACYCGKTGCIETFLSGPALVNDFVRGRTTPPAAATEDAPPPVRPSSAEAIVALAQAGLADAEVVLRRYEQRLARALASVINVLDPDVIVLGGGLSNISRLYENVPQYWDTFVFAAGVRERVRTRLVRAMHGDSSGVRGAARLWSDG